MRANPYIGPRSFRTGERLYGRDRELRRLLDLLIAERIVLLHAPSGAGKTSLVQAALIPQLRAEGFAVLPPMRVSTEAMQGGDRGQRTGDRERGEGDDALLGQLLGLGGAAAAVASPASPVLSTLSSVPSPNRYILSALLSLEEEVPAERQFPVEALSGMTLADYLTLREGDMEPSDGVVLLFDQFEEILTVDATDTAAKEVFFSQVGDALAARHRWALFSMRDDYVGALEPYVRPIPTQLRSTFHLDLLDVKAAAQAMQGPVRAAGAEFTDAAASQLCDDLRRVRVLHADGSTSEQLGPYVEPVQLQVVCYRLWERLPEDDFSIDPEDVAALGDVDSALTGYYAERVRGIAAATGVSERAIRDWCEGGLITEQGIRGQVIEGAAGLDARAIRGLVDAHLVRGEKRRGATWFELAHDRLIAPVKSDNAAWREAHLSALQRQAALWERQSRPDGLLFRDDSLDEAEGWAAANAELLTESERDYLAACQEARAAAARERRNTRRIRRLGIASVVAGVAAVIVAGLAIWQYFEARHQANVAEVRALVAAQREALSDNKLQRALLLGIEAVQRERDYRLSLGTPGTGLRAALLAAGGDPVLVEDAIPREVRLSDSGSSITTLTRDGVVWRAAPPTTAPAVLLDLAISAGEQVNLSPDGRRALAISSQRLRVWDLQAPQRPLIDLAEADLAGQTVTPDLRWLIASIGGVWLRWDLTQARPERTLLFEQSVENPMIGPTWAYDSERNEVVVVTPAFERRTVVRVDLKDPAASPAIVREDLPGDDTATFMALNPGRMEALLHSTQALELWSLDDAEKAPLRVGYEGGEFRTIAFSPGTAHVVALGDADGVVSLWDVDRDDPPLTLQGPRTEVSAIGFSPDSNLVAVGSSDGTIRVWRRDRPSDQPRLLLGHDSRVTVLSLADGLILSKGDAGDWRLWQLERSLGEPLILPTGAEGVRQLRYSADGSRLLGERPSGTLRWAVADPDAEPEQLGQIAIGALSPDGRTLAGVSFAGELSIRASAEGLRPDEVAAIVSPDGRLAIAQPTMTELLAWDIRDPTAPVAVAGPSRMAGRLTFSHDGALLAGISGTQVVVWHTDDLGGEPLELKGPDSGVAALAFSANNQLAVAWDDASVAVWDLNGDASQARPLPGQQGRVKALAFRPDGKQLASASSEGVIRIWALDEATPQPSVLQGHDDEILALAFSPDGQQLATAGVDRTVRVWTVDVAQLIGPACRLAGRNLNRGEWEELYSTAANYRRTCPNLPQPGSGALAGP